MKPENPYAWMIPLAQKFFAEEQRKEQQLRKARFTLITNTHEEKHAVPMSNTPPPIESQNFTAKPEGSGGAEDHSRAQSLSEAGGHTGMTNENREASLRAQLREILNEAMSPQQEQKPRSTLITNTHEETENDSMSTDEKPAAQAIRTRPLNEHGAFLDISAHLDTLFMAGSALKGIGSMMNPVSSRNDEKLVETSREEAAAVFRFFGMVLKEAGESAYDAWDRLERAANGELV